MQKTRRMFGFTFQRQGVIAPNEPIKVTVNLPTGATYHSIEVDGKGNFVMFCECWSHAEGTEVNHEEHQYLIIATQKDIPAGWDWVTTIMTIDRAFHFFKRGTPQLEIAT